MISDVSDVVGEKREETYVISRDQSDGPADDTVFHLRTDELSDDAATHPLSSSFLDRKNRLSSVFGTFFRKVFI